MFSWLKRTANKFVNKSTSIAQEPLNKVSIIIIIILDIFVLFNVFSGLDSISQWPLTPSEELPCYSAYTNYQIATNKDTFELKAKTIENIVEKYKFSQEEIDEETNRLGKVSSLCQNYLSLEKSLNTPENQELTTNINGLREDINRLEEEISNLKSQYDSTLLEKIAGQNQNQSINQANADNIKAKIDDRTIEIKQIRENIANNQNILLNNPSSVSLLNLLNDESQYELVKQAYKKADFWYPNKKILLQGLFLLPLIFIAYYWHNWSNFNGKNLQTLISWHLLLIFCIPLVIKFFEFIQFGNLVAIVVDFITTILGGLLFLASYLYIFVIPLLGFWLIKFLQKFIFNAKIQAKKRVQKVRCINCNLKLRLSDEFCPNCGYHQYRECPNCQQKTYKFTNFCHQCGHNIYHD